MRKFLKYLLGTILILTALLILSVAMVYLPVVQKYAKDKAVAYVERHMGLKTEIGNFSLKFPFRVQLDNVFAGKSITDTLLCAGQ